jgi:myo-inositol-1(or 4)-monophosphatase
LPHPDIDRFLAAAEAAADVAGTVIRPFFRAGLGAELKGDRSPVTIADRSAEQAMRAVLSERLPGHGILGEEFGVERPDAALRWVLDPIDGTRAFITGRPIFGTLLALLDGDTPILGVIDQPVTGERWIGAAGRPTVFRGPASGAFGGRIGCRACPGLDRAEVSCTSPEMFGADLPAWQRLTAAAGRTTYGGDCYAYGLLALGQIDVIAEAGLKIWDWAAIAPVIQGAGGRMTDWSGRKLRPDGDGRVLAVGDGALLAPALALLAASAAADGAPT